MKYIVLHATLFFIGNFYAQPYKVLIGSPIRQKPAILKEFLQSLHELHGENFEADYLFINDNTNPESTQLLYDFMAQTDPHCKIAQPNQMGTDSYVCDEKTHYWHERIIWKVAAFKDFIIDYARDHGYDYLFLIDSDIVLYQQTLDHLVTLGKDIVSNVFWTQWQPGYPKLPQVWYYDEYKQYVVNQGEQLSQEEMIARKQHFVNQMALPGTYEVGGLGACTLISRQAILKGINFKKIKNITFWGEDRHFCIRASALGIDLFVDTHYPAYHIYRESDLEGVPQFKQNCLEGIYQI